MALLSTRLTRALDLRHPIVSAPMAFAGGGALRGTRVADIARQIPSPKGFTARIRRNAFTNRWHGREEELERNVVTEGPRYRQAFAEGDPENTGVWFGEAALCLKRHGGRDARIVVPQPCNTVARRHCRHLGPPSMTLLVVGLVVFLGAHSVRIFAEDWRGRQLARLGERKWKAGHSLVSIAGFVLVCWGYALARETPVDLWNPPVWTRHVAALLTLPAFVLVAAAKVPGTRIKAAVHHPMVLGVKVWALAHLIANGRLADLLLFGAFLLWSVFDYRAARERDRATGTTYPAGTLGRDAIAVAAGFVAWAAFAFYLHAWLIGVRPFG